MAISGGATQSFDMRVRDGVLRVGRYALRQGVVSDPDEAIKQLLEGKLVFVHAYANTVERVTKAVQAALGETDV